MVIIDESHLSIIGS